MKPPFPVDLAGRSDQRRPAASRQRPVQQPAGKLIERFSELREQFGFQLLHMACCRDTEEDRGTVQYLQDCAAEAGVATEFLYIEDIGPGEKVSLPTCRIR